MSKNSVRRLLSALLAGALAVGMLATAGSVVASAADPEPPYGTVFFVPEVIQVEARSEDGRIHWMRYADRQVNLPPELSGRATPGSYLGEDMYVSDDVRPTDRLLENAGDTKLEYDGCHDLGGFTNNAGYYGNVYLYAPGAKKISIRCNAADTKPYIDYRFATVDDKRQFDSDAEATPFIDDLKQNDYPGDSVYVRLSQHASSAAVEEGEWIEWVAKVEYDDIGIADQYYYAYSYLTYKPLPTNEELEEKDNLRKVLNDANASGNEKENFSEEQWADYLEQLEEIAKKIADPKYVADEDDTKLTLDKVKETTLDRQLITYDYNGGVADGDAIAPYQAEQGAVVSLDPLAKKDGWTFAGWSLDQEVTDLQQILATAPTVAKAPITLYAAYYQNIEASFVDAGGTNALTGKIWKDGGEAEFDLPALATKSEWTPIGWTTDSEADAAAITGVTTVSIGADTAFYGLYMQTVKLSYALNGGSGTLPADAQAVRYMNYNNNAVKNPSFLLEDASLTRTGYGFIGWTVAGKEYNPTDTTDEIADLALPVAAALWEADTFTVALDYNDGSGTIVNATVAYDQPYADGIDWPADPLLAAHGFAGWYTAKTGGDKLDKASPVKLSGDITLYAQWSPTDKTALKAYIAQVKDTQQEASGETEWAAFKAALKTAQDTDADADATQEAVDAALAALKAAVSALTPRERDLFSNELLKLTRKEQTDVFANAIATYGAPLRFKSDKKITVNEKGEVSYKFAAIGKTTVIAYDAVTNEEIDSIEVKVSWNWWQWIVVILFFGWIYL